MFFRRRRSRQPKYPAPPKDAEIIVRDSVHIDATSDVEVYVPDIVVLSNESGYRWLAKFFTFMANRDVEGPVEVGHGDPEDHFHQHLGITEELSDRIEFRFGHITNGNREALFDKFEINPNETRPQDYRERIAKILNYIARQEELRVRYSTDDSK